MDFVYQVISKFHMDLWKQSDINFALWEKKRKCVIWKTSFPLRNKFKAKFYWSIVALQWCVHFFCIAKWISYMYTYIPSFLDFLPVLITTEHWIIPCPIHRFSLVIYLYRVSIVYICQISIFQFIPSTLLSPLSSIHLFSMSVSLFLLCI